MGAGSILRENPCPRSLSSPRNSPGACCNWRARCSSRRATGRSIRRSIPTVAASVSTAVRRDSRIVARRRSSRIGITPDTLMIEGAAADASQTAPSPRPPRCCTTATCCTSPSSARCQPDAVHAFLRILDARRRPSAGSAAVPRRSGRPTVIRRSRSSRSTTRSCWRAKKARSPSRPSATISGGRSSCRSPAARRRSSTSASQERLLAIAGSPLDIGDLATAVMAPKCALDGSPMITLAGRHGARRLPPPDEHRVGDVAGAHARGDEQPRRRRRRSSIRTSSCR